MKTPNKHVKVIIADDNPANIKVLLDFLGETGFRVAVALNGKSALAKAIEFQPDIILLDVKMPGLDGFETCRLLKETSQTKEIPVIFLSALDEVIDKVKAFEAGGVDYITKPFHREEVLARIKHHLNLQLAKLEILRLNEELKKQVDIQNKQIEAINLALQEKEVLLAEVHHRVKNNLQIVSSLLRLQSRSTQDAATLAALSESQHRIDAIAMIHHLMYESKNFAQIDFDAFLKRLSNSLLYAYKAEKRPILLTIDAANQSLDLNQAIPCALIVNELLTNSLRHAFPGEAGGKIYISLHQDDDRHVLTVEDNGVGLSSDLDLQNLTSPGFTLVKILTNQIRGTFNITSDKATKATIIF